MFKSFHLGVLPIVDSVGVPFKGCHRMTTSPWELTRVLGCIDAIDQCAVLLAAWLRLNGLVKKTSPPDSTHLKARVRPISYHYRTFDPHK